MSKTITQRDREYIKKIYLLGGKEIPTSPSELAREMNVSKVGALDKMRRLEELGFAEYIKNKGILLNSKGIKEIEEGAKRHHLVEKFLRESLDIDQEEACVESTKIAFRLSNRTIEKISSQLDPGTTCRCGFRIGKYTELRDLKNCPWLNNEKILEER